MKVEIFDVGHGHCSVVTAPNGARIMLDCGRRRGDEDFWAPSCHYAGQRVEILVPLNLDEDHFADFGNVMKYASVGYVMTNSSIGPREFIALKSAGMGIGAKAYLGWLSAPKTFTHTSAIALGGVQIREYFNSYGGQINKSNDLSMAVVVQYGTFKILFTGDLEKKGWDGLLANPHFVADLIGVRIVVASHHGRRNGCHEGLFKLLTPEIVIISDDEKEHETQETHAWYHWRVHGIPVQGTDNRRHVYTTRRDGNMSIAIGTDGRWLISPNVYVQSWPISGGSASGGLLG